MTSDQHAFLREQATQLGNALLHNEEAGERRLSFYMGIVTATVGGLAFLASSERPRFITPETIRVASIVALLTLLLIGAVTLLRVMRRNAVTDGFVNALTLLRDQLAPESVASALKDALTPQRTRPFWNGGLAQLTATVNAVLAGAAAALATLPVLNAMRVVPGQWVSVAIGVLSFGCVIVLEFRVVIPFLKKLHTK